MVFLKATTVVGKVKNTVDEIQTNNVKQHSLLEDFRQALIHKMNNEMSEKTFLDYLESKFHIYKI
jgi:hypothetical protein